MSAHTRLLHRFALGLAMLVARPASSDSLTGGEFSLVGSPTGSHSAITGGDFLVEGSAGGPFTDTVAGGEFILTGGFGWPLFVPHPAVDTPSLTVVRLSDGGAQLSWPAAAAGYILEYATQLGETADWRPVVPVPAGTTYVSDPVEAALFFRLRKP